MKAKVLQAPPKKFNLVQSNLPFFPVVTLYKNTMIQISDHLDQIYLQQDNITMSHIHRV